MYFSGTQHQRTYLPLHESTPRIRVTEISTRTWSAIGKTCDRYFSVTTVIEKPRTVGASLRSTLSHSIYFSNRTRRNVTASNSSNSSNSSSKLLLYNAESKRRRTTTTEGRWGEGREGERPEEKKTHARFCNRHRIMHVGGLGLVTLCTLYYRCSNRSTVVALFRKYDPPKRFVDASSMRAFTADVSLHSVPKCLFLGYHFLLTPVEALTLDGSRSRNRRGGGGERTIRSSFATSQNIYNNIVISE